MTYIVFNKNTGEVIREYQKIIGESGETTAADPDEILSDLPRNLKANDVDFIPMFEPLMLQRNQVYQVDLKTKKLVSKPK